MPTIAITSRTRLREAAELIAADARKLSGTWSKRVPASVKVTLAGDDIALITAGGPPAPQAYTFESPEGPPGVWHPVYGHGPRKDWRWVRQDPRPFLGPAADAMAEAAMIQYAKVTDDWARQLGFR